MYEDPVQNKGSRKKVIFSGRTTKRGVKETKIKLKD